MAAPERPPVKVVVLGAYGVGKTTLIMRCANIEFNHVHIPTIGTGREMATVFVDGSPIQVALWDTAGQERFRDVSKVASRGADCGVFVAAGNDEDSFLELESRVNSFFEVNDKVCPIVLAVNKVDLVSEWEWTVDELMQTYGSRFASTFFVSGITAAQVSEMLEYVARIADEYRQTKAQPRVAIVDLKRPERKKRCDC
jgi:small GTP-binding protein